MGDTYEFECPHCHYHFTAELGVGFLYPKYYAEMVEKAKNGELGEEMKELFEVYPDAAINPELVLFQCDSCGEYESAPLLDMYIPKEGIELPKADQKGRWSVAMPFYGAEYVWGNEFDKYYDLWKHYDHRCKNCNGHMSVVPRENLFKKGEIFCPHCYTEMKCVGGMRWD